ncbi:hypothetical protein QJS83_12705 [Bdellovibrio sp. 22V]|uniref:hypothetical protein n=1 Tax=Bdellovibrio TaxID=958 RepID=UPI0025429820|nr:hypothetical protein [Bdellovibrio sp. 22V]WII71323.1 hypothetical protein QJS83_12705 [Bdellovibrio sp. 22V]
MSNTYPTLLFGFQSVWTLIKISGGVFAAGFLLHHFSGFLRVQISSLLGDKGFNVLFGIGIVMHEISHALMAFLFLHEIIDIKFFDLKAKGGTHGHVISRARNVPMLLQIWQKMGELFIGIAPLIIGPLICAAVFYFLIPGGKTFVHNPRFLNFPAFTWKLALWFYVTLAIFSQMELSDADLKGTWKGYAWLVTVTFGLSLLYYKLKHF